MYHKRLRVYKKIGYEIALNLSSKKQKTNAIFDAETYNTAYTTDLSQANSEIVISSPGINATKVKQLILAVSSKLAQGVKVSVITIPYDEYPNNRIEPTKRLVGELRQSGIYVKEASGTHEHFAVIDKEIVWYGSMNMLSRENADDNLIRVTSKEIADELLELAFGSN
jgi:phosphatidylserine/phosphatidylglycerophosphate/cardiolipin synthase-like enzyme